MKKLLSICAISIIVSACSTDASQQAVNASGTAASQGAVASAQGASAVAAVPLKAVGSVGKAADKAGDALLKDIKKKDKFEVDKKPVVGAPPSLK